jgi:hypothetical protein
MTPLLMSLAFFGAARADEPAAPGASSDASASASSEASLEVAETVYLSALASWKRHDYEEALASAREAIALDPSLRAARLLEAYVLVRLDEQEEGVAHLRELAVEPAGDAQEEEIGRRARLLSLRITDKWRRDQFSFAIGQVIDWEEASGGVVPVLGPTLDLQIPVAPHLAVRVEAATDWADGSGLFDVGGQTLGALLVLEQPIGRGRWSYDVGVGEVSWFARGGYWEDGRQVYPGFRAAVGVDARLARRFGLRWQVGTRAYPGLASTLPWYGQPLDTRFSAIWWLGK